MDKPIIHTSEDGYYLSYDGEDSHAVPFGTALEVELGGKQWLCGVDLPVGKDEAGETEAMFNEWLYEVTPVLEDDIEFDEEDDEDDEDEDDTDDGVIEATAVEVE